MFKSTGSLGLVIVADVTNSSRTSFADINHLGVKDIIFGWSIAFAGLNAHSASLSWTRIQRFLAAATAASADVSRQSIACAKRKAGDAG